MKYKIILKLFAFSFLLSLSIAAISNWKIDYNSLIGFIAYFYFSAYCLVKYKNELSDLKILLYLICFQFILHIDSIYDYFFNSLFSLPLFSLHTLGIISGYLFLRIKNLLRFLPFLICSLSAVFMFFQGWDYWIHNINFGTYTGKVQAHNSPTKFEAFNEQKNVITDKDFQNKIVLLDFWTTTCGICFQKFPQVQSIHEKYKNDSSVVILAVNSPIEEDKPNQAFNDIREEGHTFPVVITKEADLAEKWGVKGYPTTFVINQNGQIIYKGDIEGAVKMVDELYSNPR